MKKTALLILIVLTLVSCGKNLPTDSSTNAPKGEEEQQSEEQQELGLPAGTMGHAQ